MTLCRFSRALAIMTAVTLWLCAGALTSAQADQPTLDELLNLAPADESATTETGNTGEVNPDEGEDLAGSVEQALSASAAADAFEQAVLEMDQVSRRLGRSYDPGIQTQRMQESILRKLDRVIESARQQQPPSGGGSGSSGKPRDQDSGGEQVAKQGSSASGQDQPQDGGQQASTGGASSGSPQDPTLQDKPIEQLRREWGVLPPRLRDELSEGLRERFSPLYRRMTEDYYKALAEQE